MSQDRLIKVENVSKKYCRSLKKSMLYGISDIAKDLVGIPLKSNSLKDHEFWSNRNISFEVNRGECIGIIGPNGAGKSTLLKMLNGIFLPDEGQITMRGRIGAMIEVGAGFHPMLSGRENIYINGSILGLRKKEILNKFDEIVAFAELEDHIDMPVKHYSSGMYVRLGFSIAICLEVDVLLLDEVLAVGDVSFRAKCYNAISDRMKDCAVILVSHDMPAVARYVDKVLLMNNGHASLWHDVNAGITAYHKLTLSKRIQSRSLIENLGNRLIDLKLIDQHGNICKQIQIFEKLAIRLRAKIQDKYPICHIGFIGTDQSFVASARTMPGDLICDGKQYLEATLTVGPMPLAPGEYKISLIILDRNRKEYLIWYDAIWELYVNGDPDYMVSSKVIIPVSSNQQPKPLAASRMLKNYAK